MATNKRNPNKGDAVEDFVAGEITLIQAIRKWLHRRPMKRGWYIVIILFLITGYATAWALYNHVMSNINNEHEAIVFKLKHDASELRREKDVAELKLVPYMTLLGLRGTNTPFETKLDLLLAKFDKLNAASVPISQALTITNGKIVFDYEPIAHTVEMTGALSTSSLEQENWGYFKGKEYVFTNQVIAQGISTDLRNGAKIQLRYTKK